MTPKHSFDAGGPDSAAILRYVSGESPLPEAESIRAWPDQAGLAVLMKQAGWTLPHWRNLSGGIVALHRAHA